MKKNLTMIVLLSNILFYLGIGSAIYLYLVDDNTPKWLGSILCLVVGIVGSAIPDSVINIGIEELSVKFVRMGMLLKYISFVVCFTFLDSILLPTIVLLGILFLIDLWVEYFLIKEIDNKNILIEDFIQGLKEFDSSPLDSVFKYLIYNILSILLFLNIHENMIECAVMLTICIIVHAYVSKRCIEQMNFEQKHEKFIVGLVLWTLELILLLLAYFEKTMVVCIVFSDYYMIVADLIMQNKTSIIRRRKGSHK